MRDDSLADHNVTFFFQNDDPHIILLIKDDNLEERQLEEYKNAVKGSPRKFIYAVTDINKPESAKYLELFQLANKSW